MGKEEINSLTANILYGIVVWIATLLGLQNLAGSILGLFDLKISMNLTLALTLLALFISLFFFFRLQRKK
jgi:hypothetical protein